MYAFNAVVPNQSTVAPVSDADFGQKLIEMLITQTK